MRVFLLLSCCSFLLLNNAAAQTEEESKEGGNIIISASPSFTWVPKGAALDNRNDEGHFVPGMGVDFFYRFSPRWEVGTMIDIEFAHYVIPRKEELERERAFIVTAMMAYTITDRLSIFGGGGVEVERNESFGVARLGGEYAQPLKNGWFLPVGAFIDMKPGFSAWSLMIGIGKRL